LDLGPTYFRSIGDTIWINGRADRTNGRRHGWVKKAEVKPMRIVILLAGIAIWASQPAIADVRHSGFPKSLQGTWAPSAELCGGDGKSRIIISEKRVVAPKVDCAIDYVVETAASAGAFFSGHGSCFDREQPDKKSIMNLVVQPGGGARAKFGATLDSLTEYRRCAETQ
jgi:hypothetical protein